MYKQDKPELEDYLLGHKVDKHIDNEAELMAEKNKGDSLTDLLIDFILNHELITHIFIHCHSVDLYHHSITFVYISDTPGASFDEDVILRRIDLDMNAKMREDPLFAIK